MLSHDDARSGAPTASRSPAGGRPSLSRTVVDALSVFTTVSVSAFDRAIASVDASHYLLTPCAVVKPKELIEIAGILRVASAMRQTITFRSGGTSLSGQASSDGILVDTRTGFRAIHILDDGRRVRVGPGATLRQVNARLLRHGRKLGPDPASEIACTIGGVIANNSSGMACGITQNAYQTLESAVIVLPSGTVVDSARQDADRRLRSDEPALWEALLDLKARVMATPAMRDEIARQFSMKNTMGYGLNALIDYASPVEILTHLMVGSEGTLGFIAEATFRTVPLLAHAATALLIFASLHDAMESLVNMVASGAATVEVMDAASLRAARADPSSSSVLPTFEVVEHCALLVEYQGATAEALRELVAPAQVLFGELPLVAAPALSTNAHARAALWHIRKGLYATIAGQRPPGTTALLEDIAVPLDRLASTCAGLQRLFEAHRYDDAVIFGHAKDGNVHFLITEDFRGPEGLQRYRSFTEDMVDLVLAAGGTLKAEHGTGRIMAPFVERQYGADLYRLMSEIKKIFDPVGVLSPGIVITDDADLHLRNLKTTPEIDGEVDRCVECGYCEPFCPSKDLTTTPRQRIVARRAIADAEARGDVTLVKELRRAHEYNVVDTCAVDGMCQIACPVRINTGDLVRRLRSDSVGVVEEAAWRAAGHAWGVATRGAASALSIASRIPSPFVAVPNEAIRGVLGHDTIPLWSPDLPAGGRPRAARADESSSRTPDAVYFQACVGSMFGPGGTHEGVASAFTSLARKAGVVITQPERIDALCCGTPWKSKGMLAGYDSMATRTAELLWNSSHHGDLPIVCDNSSCSEGLTLALSIASARHREYASMRVVDVVDFAAAVMLPYLEIARPLGSVVVHPTCSSTRAESNSHLIKVTKAFAANVTIPDDWGCCGFAGDRGMLHPELTASATLAEAAEVQAEDFEAYLSCNRTCEIGMSRATGRPYEHVLEALDRASDGRRNI